MAFGYWTERHIDSERKLNLRAAIDKAANNPEKLKEIRGSLAPHLRDTLVAYNYANYAPPGAQILMTNPVFVRGHDFLGMQGSNHTWKACEMMGSGWPSNAGGRLMGSLAGLALCARRSRTELPDSHPDASPDLGRPGSANDPQRQDSSLVERDARAGPLRRTAHAPCPGHAGRIGAQSRRPANRFWTYSSCTHRPIAQLVRANLESGDLSGALDALTPAELYDIGARHSRERFHPVGRELRAMLTSTILP